MRSDEYDNLAAVDIRYFREKFIPYISENAFTAYKLKVELAGLKVQAKYNLCPATAVREMEEAIEQVTTAAVYKEEKEVTKHDIVALVHIVRSFMSPEAAPFVHRFATSYDIIDSARAMMYRDFIGEVLVPDLLKFQKVLIGVARREAATPQIGRTHLQHAVPITFGYSMAEFISRMGNCIKTIQYLVNQLHGKFSGPVGAYNAGVLLLDKHDIDPIQFESEVLAELGLTAGEYAKQIVMPEPVARLLMEVAILSGAFVNLAQNMRYLQAPEINEVMENFDPGQAGSSAMPFKKNPIASENTISMFKIISPRIITVLLDLVSDLQRDLTNSASSRTYFELLAYLDYTVVRMTNAMEKLYVNREAMARNMLLTKGTYAAEPLQNAMAMMGCTNAYELTQALSDTVKYTGRRFQDLMLEDETVVSYFNRLDSDQRRALMDETAYSGLSQPITLRICDEWERRLGL